MKTKIIESSIENSRMKQYQKVKVQKILFLGLFAVLLNACSSTIYLNTYTPLYTTTINSFGNYSVVGKTFYIESGNKDVPSNDLEFCEYSRYIATSLKLQGAIETNDKINADMCVLVNYGITDESYVETVPFPIWGQTGISSINTTSNTTGSAYGSATRIGNSVYGSLSGNSTTNTTTQINPTYGITGYASVNKKVNQFCRILNIYSYDNRLTNEPTMLWKTNLVSYGSSGDFRKVLPYMAFMAWGQMGRSTEGISTYSTLEDDYFFRCWKRGILNQPNITTYPIIKSTNVSSFIQIAAVEKSSYETLVILRKNGCPDYYRINPNTYIEYDGKRYLIKSVDDYILGKKIKRECGVRYFLMRFPSIPSDANEISIRENSKNGSEWNGILIR